MKWNHVGIKTSNVDRSMHFYCDILGLRKQEDVEIMGKMFHFVGNDEISIEIEECNPGDTQADVRVLSGLYHLSFTVEDVKGLVSHLEANKVPIALPPMQSRPDRITAFVEDPDGVFIQLIELTD